jgi:isopenicillin N synthase-like dioxygenase
VGAALNSKLKPTTIDFSQLGESKELSRLKEVCENQGFFSLSNHGISQQLRDQFLQQTTSFFTQPMADKLALERTESNPFGFYNKERTKNQLDRKEVFDISLSTSTPTKWPTDEQFIATMTNWHKACEAVAMTLLKAIFDSLHLKADSAFFQPEHTSFLRLNYYPLDPSFKSDNNSEEILDGQFGVSHHTDAGALTLLQQDLTPGLQFFSCGEWHTAPTDPEMLLVNLGDMLQIWTNDQFIAPLHRVLASDQSVRFSAPYFLNPAYSCDCMPLLGAEPHYRTVNWGEFRGQRALGDYADVGEEVQIDHYRLN